MRTNTKNNECGGAFVRVLFIAVMLWPAAWVSAQEAEPVVELQPLEDEQAEQFDVLRQQMERTRAKIADLERRLNDVDEGSRGIYVARLDKLWIQLVGDGLKIGEAVIAEQERNVDVGEYRAAAIAILEAQGEIAGRAWQRVRDRAVLPGRDESAADQAAGYHRLFELQRITDQIFEDFIVTLDLLERFGAETPDDEAAFKALIAERAMNVSVFLELSIDEVAGLGAGVDVLPDDAELKAKLAVAQARVGETAAALQRVVDQMATVGLDTAEFQAQLLTATGAITTDIFNFAVIRNLLARWGETVVDLMVDDGPTFLFRLAIFVIIVLAARKLGQGVEKLAGRTLDTAKFHLSQLLKRMIVSTVGNLIMLFGVLIALSQLGISLGPLLAGLGIAGFVIGFALQDTLGNFASGLMILFYRPFDVGDVVEVGGVFGKVNHMSLVNTKIMTLDNQTIVLPNNLIWGGVIKNLTDQKHRRVDLTFGVSYTDDIPKVEKVLADAMAAHDKVLDDPEPTVRLHELGDSSVNFIVRPWVESDDYWDVYWDLTRTIKMRFDEEGISIPFPQRDVHLYTTQAPAVPPGPVDSSAEAPWLSGSTDPAPVTGEDGDSD